MVVDVSATEPDVNDNLGWPTPPWVEGPRCQTCAHLWEDEAGRLTCLLRLAPSLGAARSPSEVVEAVASCAASVNGVCAEWEEYEE